MILFSLSRAICGEIVEDGKGISDAKQGKASYEVWRDLQLTIEDCVVSMSANERNYRK